MSKPVKVINPGGVFVECLDTDNGYQKALRGIDGWKLPETVKDKGEGPAPSPTPSRKGKGK